MIEIVDTKDSRIQAYTNLKKPKLGQNTFIAENEKVVIRLLNSQLIVHSVLGTYQAIQRNITFLTAKGISPDKMFVCSKQNLEEIVGFSIHRGIMAEAEIPRNPALSTLENPIIILNRIYDSENIGAILRTARAFGIKDLIFDQESSHPYLRRSVRVSMGNIFTMRIHKAPSLEETIQNLKKDGYNLLGASANFSHPKNESIYKINFPTKWALLLGNEAEGISKHLEELCDTLLHIPMSDTVDSMNVSHCLASLLAIWQNKN
jgi:tRNA G18 (ribose-2'-O)-methylase SpoU